MAAHYVNQVVNYLYPMLYFIELLFNKEFHKK